MAKIALGSRTIIAIAGMTLMLCLIIYGNASALQQAAGKIEITLPPGQSKTLQWGLLSDSDGETEVALSADGIGSEFLSFPDTVKLPPGELVYIPIDVTVPEDHPGSVTLTPALYATQFGASGGQTVVNIQMQKAVTVTVEPNPDPELRELRTKPFVENVKIGSGETIPLKIETSSEVSRFEFDEQKKLVSFEVSGMAGTSSIATIEIGSVLEGPFTVLLDDQPASSFETVRSDASDPDKLQINYDGSVDKITVIGTRVVPEFAPAFAGALAAASIAAVTVFAKRRAG